MGPEDLGPRFVEVRGRQYWNRLIKNWDDGRQLLIAFKPPIGDLICHLKT